MEAHHQAREAMTALYRRFADAVNTRNLDLLDDLFDPELLNHGADPSEPRGAYHFKQVFTDFIAACPDLRVCIEDRIVEGDIVVVRWVDIGTYTGAPLFDIPATGKEISLSGIDILRVRNGTFVERWSESDVLYVLRTLGIL